MEDNIYKNILVIVVGFLVISWIFNLEYFLIAATVIGLLSIFFSKFASGLNWLWIKLALGLGWVNSRILLSVLYYVFLVPIAFMAKLFIGSPMNIKKQEKSMYLERNHLYSKQDLINIW